MIWGGVQTVLHPEASSETFAPVRSREVLPVIFPNDKGELVSLRDKNTPLVGDTSLAVKAGGATYVYSGLRHRFTRRADGGSAVDISQGVIRTNGPTAGMTAMTAYKDTLFVGLDNYGVCHTEDGGFKWECAPLPGASATALAVLEVQGHPRLIAGTAIGAFASENGGKSWSLLRNRDGSPFDVPIGALEPGVVDGHAVLVAGGPSGLFAWDDKGWSPLREGPVVTGFTHGSEGRLFALTTSEGAVEVVFDHAIALKEPIARGLHTPRGGAPAPLLGCRQVDDISSPWVPQKEGNDGKMYNGHRAGNVCWSERHAEGNNDRELDYYDQTIYEFVSKENRFRRLDRDIHQEGAGSPSALFPLAELRRGTVAVLTSRGTNAHDDHMSAYVSVDNGVDWTGQVFPLVVGLDRVERSGSDGFVAHGSNGFTRVKVASDGQFAASSFMSGDSKPYSSCASPIGQPETLFCLEENRVATENRVQRSGDGGATFKELGTIRGRGIMVSPTDPKRIFAGGFISKDGGWTWQPGLPGWSEEAREGVEVIGVLLDGRPVCDLSRTGKRAGIKMDDLIILDAACSTLPPPPGGRGEARVLPSRAIPGAYYLGAPGLGMVYLGPGEKAWRRMEGF